MEAMKLWQVRKNHFQKYLRRNITTKENVKVYNFIEDLCVHGSPTHNPNAILSIALSLIWPNLPKLHITETAQVCYKVRREAIKKLSLMKTHPLQKFCAETKHTQSNVRQPLLDLWLHSKDTNKDNAK